MCGPTLRIDTLRLNFRKAHAGRGLYDDPTTIGTLHIPGLSMPQFTIGHGRRVQDDTDTAVRSSRPA